MWVQSATLKNISPLRLSFVDGLRVIRRAVSEFQRQINNQLDINTYSTSRCHEVQEPHPHPPPRWRGGGLRCTS